RAVRNWPTSISRTALSGQVAHERWGAKDRREYRQAAGTIAQTLTILIRRLIGVGRPEAIRFTNVYPASVYKCRMAAPSETFGRAARASLAFFAIQSRAARMLSSVPSLSWQMVTENPPLAVRTSV